MVANQVRYFTLRYYFRELAEGLEILHGGASYASHLYYRKLKTKLRERLRRNESQDVEHLTATGANKADETDLQHVENLLTTKSSSSLIQLANGKKLELCHAQGEDDHPTTLHYSFVLLSKMLNTCLLYIPAFTLNLRFGLSPSRPFLVTSYLSLIAFFIGSLYQIKFTIEPSIQMFVGRMNNNNLKRICIISAVIAQIGYAAHGFFSCAYVLYQRQFLQNFIYHRCSIITLARSYQRRLMIYLFAAFSVFAFMSEPLFGMLALSQDLRQPNYWPSLEPTTFKLCKSLTIVACGVSATMLSSGTVVIPLMTCFLIMSSMKHLKNLVVKQSTRCSQTAAWANASHSDQLLKLLNSKTRSIMVDFACETLTMDWPSITEAPTPLGAFGSVPADWHLGQQQDSPAEHGANGAGRPSRGSQFSGSNSVSSVDGRLNSSWPSLDSAAQANGVLLNSSKASSLLFLYKNLIKSLSELKGVIRDYERKFGNFHQVSSLLACLMISLWVTSALTEVRQSSKEAAASAAAGAAAAAANTTPLETEKEAEYKRQRAAYTLRIFWNALAFVLSNIFTFLKCDCLSDRITKIKSQLFKMNIDLACTFISVQRKQTLQNLIEQTSTAARVAPMTMPRIRISSDSPDSGSSLVGGSSGKSSLSGKPSKSSAIWTSSVYEVNHWRKSLPMLQYEHHASQCPELDQIWSLYDQVDRISSRVNFRFSSDTYYSKKCMLVVFGRAVSLILFYIQIIDMYSG